MAFSPGSLEREAAGRIGGLGIRASCQQRLERFQGSGLGGVMEGGEAGVIPGFERGTTAGT